MRTESAQHCLPRTLTERQTAAATFSWLSVCLQLLHGMYTHIETPYTYIHVYIYIYPPTPAGAAPRSSVHVCSPLSTTRPLPFLQIAIGPRLPHPFYCSGISPPPPGTRRFHSAVLGTTSRPRLLDPFTPRHHKPSSVAPPCLF